MIDLIGLGPADADAITPAARDALRAAGVLFLRTERHPAAQSLRAAGVCFDSFDALYEAAPSFDALYEAICDRVLAAASAGNVAYAVPGHPLVAEESVRRIIARARNAGVAIRIVGSASFIEPALAALALSVTDGMLILDALAMDRLRPRVDTGALLYQVFDPQVASDVKLALMRDYPDDWEVAVVRSAGVAGDEAVEHVPLHRLDRVAVDHLTCVYVPPLPEDLRRPAFDDLVSVMARLRGDGGCPWDREQDHVTLKRYMIEECYEFLEAVDEGDPDAMCEELGDVLLQIVFHAQLGNEAGLFDSDDVIGGIVSKLIRRHPHVFGNVSAENAEQVLVNWDRIKRAEKGEGHRPSALDGVPAGMPALMQAMEISKRAVKVGFEWERVEDVLAKVEEEVSELRAAITEQTPAEIADEIGDLLFTIVNVARWQRVDPEDALRRMVTRFSVRFRRVEELARAQGRELSGMTIGEMDGLWEAAKRELGAGGG